MRGGHLREDLYYRLNVFQVHMPPLRERKADIPILGETLLWDLIRKHQCRVTGISPAVLNAFEQYNWPGNVRELRNVLERAMILAGEGAIEQKHLPEFLRNRVSSDAPVVVSVAAAAACAAAGTVHSPVGTTLAEAEKTLILNTLRYTENKKVRAAEILGISLRTLHNRLREYGPTGMREQEHSGAIS